MNLDKYTSEYFRNIRDEAVKMEEKRYDSFVASFRELILTRLEENCKMRESSLLISLPAIHKSLKIFYKMTPEMIEKDIFNFLWGRGLYPSMIKKHTMDCGCGSEKEGCTLFISVSIETPE